MHKSLPANYYDSLLRQTGMSPIWDYLRYDEFGDLWINNLRVSDAIARYGSPLEINDVTILRKRALSWMALTEEVSREISYSGDFSYFYASKANMTLPFTMAAYRAGWHIETSSVQDLVHVSFLYKKGLVSKDKEILCNGFKMVGPGMPGQYAEKIFELHADGFKITPVIDAEEVDCFIERKLARAMPVGLRMKFGKVSSDEQLAALVSRHGMEWEELIVAADQIAASQSLYLTTLHCMVGAAETIAIDQFIESLLFGARKYFLLKQKHPSLERFDIGGGIPPMTSQYNYRQFLDRFLSGVMRLAHEFQLPAPQIVFELGSFLAEESGFLVHSIIQERPTRYDAKNMPEKWAILDGGLMAELPDIFITHKSFPVLAVNGAHNLSERVVLGDLTCDTDGRYPGKHAKEQFILLPRVERNKGIVIAGTGSYQKMLGGAGGAHHCGILEPNKLIIEDFSGRVRYHFVDSQKSKDVADQLGYGGELVDQLTGPKRIWDMVYRQEKRGVI